MHEIVGNLKPNIIAKTIKPDDPHLETPAGKEFRSHPTPTELNEVLGGFREDSLWRPLAESFMFFAAYGTSVLCCFVLDAALAVVAALIAAVAGGRLFIIAHDACHGSYSPSRLFNRTMGRLAFIPSLHSYGLWEYWHNRIHHGFTNLKGTDFVWTPLSKAEFDGLPGWRRLLHRFYRGRPGWGIGIYYLLEIWLPRMSWPYGRTFSNPRLRMLIDSLLPYCFMAGTTALIMYIAIDDSPERIDLWDWSGRIFLAWAVPFIYINYCVGLVVYFNHTHPLVPWFANQDQWNYMRGQLECSVFFKFPEAIAMFMPGPIMVHTAHHVDTKVPVRLLEKAQARLMEGFGDRIPTCFSTFADCMQIMDRCKLYDYDAHRWLDFNGNPTTPNIPMATSGEKSNRVSSR